MFGGGGGLGEIYTVSLVRGQEISVTIGLGGDGGASRISGTTDDGGATTFGSYSVAGGHGAIMNDNAICEAGAASGSIASAGEALDGLYAAGGYGNVNKPSQSYGNGAEGRLYPDCNGENGAVIITVLSV